MSSRNKALLGAGVLVVVLVAAGAVFALTRGGDVSNPDVEFRAEPTETPVATSTASRRHSDPLRDFVWPAYGYTKDRRRYLPVSGALRPPFTRRWTYSAHSLLEFPPAMAEGLLFVVKNNGVVNAVDKRTGAKRWSERVGTLAASSPAYGNGRIFVTVLNRAAGRPGAIVALRARDGRRLWSRQLPSRTESSPLFDGDRVYFGSENGTVYALRAGDGGVVWTFKAGGAVKCALALSGSRLYFGDYSGRVYAIRRRDGSTSWSSGTSGSTFGLRSGQFYSTPAVAYGRVYIGNTDGRMYSFSADSGKLAWAKGTGSYVYSSPAVAQVPGGKPTVYFGSYDGTFYAVDARTGAARWSRREGGKISGGVTVIGDVVYYSNLGNKDTTGLGARTGRRIFHFDKGAFNPMISDGRDLFLTGNSQIYALRPKGS